MCRRLLTSGETPASLQMITDLAPMIFTADGRSVAPGKTLNFTQRGAFRLFV
jgi:hypothetical protein